jgi:hypothetical protein
MTDMVTATTRWWLFTGLNFMLFLGTACLALAVLLLCCWGRKEPPRPEPEPPIYSRDEFKDLLMGKTAGEVIAAVGEPFRTSEDSDTAYWHYRRRTRDPITGKIDSDVQVVFRDERVVAVNY